MRHAAPCSNTSRDPLQMAPSTACRLFRSKLLPEIVKEYPIYRDIPPPS